VSGRFIDPEGGQAGVLLVSVLALALLLASLVGRLGIAAAQAASARTAADAVALAALSGGRPLAFAVARENGATVVGLTIDGAGAHAEVRVGSARAAADAAWVLDSGEGPVPSALP